MNKRIGGRQLLLALGAYVVLAVGAGFALRGQLRLLIWVLFAGLALKTFAAYKLQPPADR